MDDAVRIETLSVIQKTGHAPADTLEKARERRRQGSGRGPALRAEEAARMGGVGNKGHEGSVARRGSRLAQLVSVSSLNDESGSAGAGGGGG